jgi:hypothetical protein
MPHEFAHGLKAALDAIEVAGVVGDGALIRKGVDSSSVQTPSHAIAECGLSIKHETLRRFVIVPAGAGQAAHPKFAAHFAQPRGSGEQDSDVGGLAGGRLYQVVIVL